MKIIGLFLPLLGLACAGTATPPSPSARIARPPAPVGEITFRYYQDLGQAAAFYEKLLGKAPDVTPAWVRLFPLSKSATIGLVNATDGSLRPADSKPVMVTLVVDGTAAVDAWFAHVNGLGIPIVQERKTTRLDEKRSIYAFIIHDTEGYAVEILSWTPTPR